MKLTSRIIVPTVDVFVTTSNVIPTSDVTKAIKAAICISLERTDTGSRISLTYIKNAYGYNCLNLSHLKYKDLVLTHSEAIL